MGPATACTAAHTRALLQPPRASTGTDTFHDKDKHMEQSHGSFMPCIIPAQLPWPNSIERLRTDTSSDTQQHIDYSWTTQAHCFVRQSNISSAGAASCTLFRVERWRVYQGRAAWETSDAHVTDAALLTWWGSPSQRRGAAHHVGSRVRAPDLMRFNHLHQALLEHRCRRYGCPGSHIE